jgi:hypothetical protein
LLSTTILPVEVKAYVGEASSAISASSFGIEQARSWNHSRPLNQSSSLRRPQFSREAAASPTLTPRTGRCSFLQRSYTPAPSPMTSIRISLGLRSYEVASYSALIFPAVTSIAVANAASHSSAPKPLPSTRQRR